MLRILGKPWLTILPGLNNSWLAHCGLLVALIIGLCLPIRFVDPSRALKPSAKRMECPCSSSSGCKKQAPRETWYQHIENVTTHAESLDEVCQTTQVKEQSGWGMKFRCDGPSRTARYFIWSHNEWQEVYKLKKTEPTSGPPTPTSIPPPFKNKKG
jgi:hypothetical protein